MYANKLQIEFKEEMDKMLAIKPNKKHFFESKNDYKDYPCECGAENNSKGGTCQRYKAVKIKEKYYEILGNVTPITQPPKKEVNK